MKHRNLHKIIFAIFLFFFSFLALFMSHKSPIFAAWYSSIIYPLLVTSIGRFFDIFPFSVAEIGLYIFVTFLLLLFMRMLISTLFHKKLTPNNFFLQKHLLKKDPSWPQYVSSLFCLCACLFFSYTFCCGINYGRTSFAEKYNLETGTYTLEELNTLCSELTIQLNTLADSVSRDSDGLALMGSDVSSRARLAMVSLGNSYPELSGYYPRPKTLLIPAFLSVQNLSGIYSPFTVEANYNSDMVAYNLPFTACHELSHLRGFMQEEEANFIGFLACVNSGDTEFEYSGYLLGWIYATNELYEEDYDTYQKMYSQLSDTVKIDLSANSAFWNKYKSKVSEVSGQINDHYLKANGQTDGVKSYDRMVDLMITWSRSH